MKRKILLSLFLCVSFVFLTGYDLGYHTFTWPEGTLAVWSNIPRKYQSDVSVWNDSFPPTRSGYDLEQSTAGAQPAISGKARDFDGSDFMALKEQDDEQGALTFVADGGTAEFRDAGQDFSDWETNPTVGLAAYRIVIHTDNGISYAYLGLANTGTGAGSDIDCYSDYALTTRGWKGRTTPQASPDTPATYEIYKVLGSDNLTGDQFRLAVLKLDDGQPGSQEIIFSDYEYSLGNYRRLYFSVESSGKLRLTLSNDGAAANIVNTITDAAVFANGAQANYAVVCFVYDASGQTVTIYVNGSLVASTSDDTIPTSLFDTFTPLLIGVYNNSSPGNYLNGAIALTIIGEGTLSAAEMKRLYNHLKFMIRTY